MNFENSTQMKESNSIIIDRIIEMAWEDRTTFEAIKFQFNLNESKNKNKWDDLRKLQK